MGWLRRFFTHIHCLKDILISLRLVDLLDMQFHWDFNTKQHELSGINQLFLISNWQQKFWRNVYFGLLWSTVDFWSPSGHLKFELNSCSMANWHSIQNNVMKLELVKFYSLVIIWNLMRKSENPSKLWNEKRTQHLTFAGNSRSNMTCCVWFMT